MSVLHRATLNVFADYYQFYIQDGGLDPAAPTEWSDGDVASRAKAERNVVVVCPLRNMTVPVELVVATERPELDMEAFDHVVQCSIELPTGYLQVHESTGVELLHLSIASGTYGVLLLFSHLNSLDSSGLAGQDRYRVVLWPSKQLKFGVLKTWQVRN